MEKNDIASTVHKHIACHFEGLLMTPRVETAEQKKRWWKRKEDDVLAYDDEWVTRQVRSWRPNEMPLKSIIHLTTKLNIGVEVYTYFDPILREHIEYWLSRKGADVQVHCYDNLEHLAEDLRYNRDVHTFFTPYEQDAAVIGWHRATVVTPSGKFGF